MADVNKIQLPDNSVVNIKDYRIPGVDSTPTLGSDNVVTSDGIASAIPSGYGLPLKYPQRISSLLHISPSMLQAVPFSPGFGRTKADPFPP